MIEVNNKNDMNGKPTQKLYFTNYNDHIHKLNIFFKQKHYSYKNILILGLVLLHCRPFKIHIYDKFQIQLT